MCDFQIFVRVIGRGSNPLGGTNASAFPLHESATVKRWNIPLGCGVIGNTGDSGSSILGSSPGGSTKGEGEII